MIEVEKKFLLDEKDKERIVSDAIFLNERVFTDIYYDDNNFSLSSKDKWLRSREKNYELKVPAFFDKTRLVDQYDEIKDIAGIKSNLGFSKDTPISEDLSNNGFSAFCICKTTRRKFRKGAFIIDLDTVDFQDFTYSIGEIELMVANQPEIEKAVEEIFKFAAELNLKITPVRGKVIEYLRRAKPDHYLALKKAGVIWEE